MSPQRKRGMGRKRRETIETFLRGTVCTRAGLRLVGICQLNKRHRKQAVESTYPQGKWKT
jgi:hypothetical protein